MCVPINRTQQPPVGVDSHMDVDANASWSTGAPDPLLGYAIQSTQENLQSGNIGLQAQSTRGNTSALTFANQFKQTGGFVDSKLDFIPPCITSEGKKRVVLSVEDESMDKDQSQGIQGSLMQPQNDKLPDKDGFIKVVKKSNQKLTYSADQNLGQYGKSNHMVGVPDKAKQGGLKGGPEKDVQQQQKDNGNGVTRKKGTEPTAMGKEVHGVKSPGTVGTRVSNEKQQQGNQNKGFNFSRAVNGNMGKAQGNVKKAGTSKPATPTVQEDVQVSNRFSALDGSVIEDLGPVETEQGGLLHQQGYGN
ncbi:hypothetical protein E3N88_13113 [Mikania micrantha]|uniref:Uncharacterized protein n=1 Tax=Mikania micrantha TaxID=192012 RepID=A0A5N6P9D7_9ASTR|nr:hypothetical protein E3N88_13113 [Mikania micrantha]